MSAEPVTSFVQNSQVCFICLIVHINLKIHQQTNFICFQRHTRRPKVDHW